MLSLRCTFSCKWVKPRFQARFLATETRPVDLKLVRKQIKALKEENTAPKRPMTPFLLFVKDRSSSLANSPNFVNLTGLKKQQALVSELSKQWKSLNEQQKKKPFISAGETARASYVRAKNDHLSSLSPRDIFIASYRHRLERKLNPDKSLAKVPKDPNAPHAPLNSYMLWSRKIRASSPDEQRRVVGKVLSSIPPSEVVRTLSSKWKIMSEAEKAPFVEEYRRLRESYEDALREYREKNGINDIRKDIIRTVKAATAPKNAPRKKRVAKKAKPAKKTARKSTKKTARKTKAKAGTSKTKSSKKK